MNLRQLIQPDREWLDAPTPRRVIWSVVFLLVTLQMTTSLRPILGRSNVRLTQEKKFFLQHWGDTFGKSLVPLAASKPSNTTPESNNNATPAETTPSRSGGNPFNDN